MKEHKVLCGTKLVKMASHLFNLFFGQPEKHSTVFVIVLLAWISIEDLKGLCEITAPSYQFLFGHFAASIWVQHIWVWQTGTEINKSVVKICMWMAVNVKSNLCGLIYWISLEECRTELDVSCCWVSDAFFGAFSTPRLEPEEPSTVDQFLLADVLCMFPRHCLRCRQRTQLLMNTKEWAELPL